MLVQVESGSNWIGVLGVLVFLASMYIAPTTAQAQTVYHVTETGNASNDGSSFADGDAISLQGALSAAGGSDEIWIAAGTYTPSRRLDAGDARTATFEITGDQDGLQIYGGFDGTETTRSERDPSANETILSGNINGDESDDSGNAYHVLVFNGGGSETRGIGNDIANNITGATVLDGVTVAGGNANGPSTTDGAGGGLYCDGTGTDNVCSPTLTELIFTGNAAIPNYTSGGGAIYNDAQDSGTSSP